MEVLGHCHPQYEEIRPLFAELWQGIEVGAALSVYRQGECIVNLWGGHADKARTRPWHEDTLVNVYSATKGVVATAIAKLVERGQLDYQDLVSKHWPEFAEQGKHKITIAQLLSHQAGLCGIREKLKVEDLYDWQKMTSLLAAQPPLWPPGTAAGYHAVTWGYLAGELIRRVSGQSVGAFIQSEICVPLNLNFYLGLDDNLLDRCAELIGPNHIARERLKAVGEDPRQMSSTIESPEANDTELFKLAQLNPTISPFKHASSSAWRQAEIPASNGHSDAHSLARLYGILANGGVAPETKAWKLDRGVLARATEVAVEGQRDLIMGQVIHRSQGGFILSHDRNYGSSDKAFGHAGAGGSMAFADPERNLGFAYVMNQLQPAGYPARYSKILDKIYTLTDKIT